MKRPDRFLLVTAKKLPVGTYPTKLCVLFKRIYLGYDAVTRTGNAPPNNISKEKCIMKHTKKICALSVTAALSLALAASAAAADYTVQRGDSLWKIAREQLGDGTSLP